MSSYNPLLPQDGTAWLLAIGQKLRVEYDDIAEPVPPRLTALLKLLEMADMEISQQSGSSGDSDAPSGFPTSAADTMRGSISTPAP